MPDTIAMPTANGASQRRTGQRRLSSGDESKGVGEVSALVIPANEMVMAILMLQCPMFGLMHSYHNVAELRQIRGAVAHADSICLICHAK